MIEIKCLECINCTGDSCKVYGSDADKAAESCADDNFKNHKLRMTRQEAIEAIEELPVMRYMKINGKQSTITTALSMAIEALKEPERKRGRWIEKSKWQSGRWVKWFECSICGEKDYNAEMYDDMPFTGLSNFCPNCGADMGSEQE